ncbi:abnormal spindle-like microcephaly-associated isoform X1 [Solea senegalensis]|uniref:Abnormal spindle-like microcephaly-associated isoform X1 n=1 Tax=Solea senegalensis TaxID=28829 RepID=A0AAV6S8K7_SOLSE|nr:abnormal spindle-like microcephaly-associated isoform X1 [Solea senegalensis]
MAETWTSTRKGFVDFSPGTRDDTDKENNVPVLSLIQFSKAPFVTFGTLRLGTSKSAVLRIENPAEDVEAEVTVEKIPSSKGFSVDHKTFTVQPEGSFSLTLTWTPAEEGGIRELITFNANGVLKHQAVLLGRAEAPKKKKKSLWDTIKNKREGGKVAVPQGKKLKHPSKMVANKTFQVPRQQQYKRDKPCSPLSSLNEGKATRRRSLNKQKEQKALNHSLAFSDQENVYHNERNSPVVLLIPAAKLMDSDSTSARPEVLATKPEKKDLNKILNATISPIGTPEKFKKIMPRSPALATVMSPADVDGANIELSRTSLLSLEDALAIVCSDLSQVNPSPQDASSFCDFSDSLESKNGSFGSRTDRNVLRPLPNSPELFESNEPRLTFFVSQKVVVSEAIASVEEAANLTEIVKKSSFTSATVIKSKAPVKENSLSGRKIKKMRRRLLEKTLELSDCSCQCESVSDTPNLPVIDPDKGNKGTLNSYVTSHPCDDPHEVLGFTSSSLSPCTHGPPPPVTFPPSSSPPVAPTCISFSITSPPPAITSFTVTSPSPRGSSSPLRLDLPSKPSVFEQCPAVSALSSARDDSFPIHKAGMSKKRKSEEYLKSDARREKAVESERVKRSKVVVGKTEASRSAQEWRGASQRQQQPRTAGSVRSLTSSSLKSTRSAVPLQKKQPSSKHSSRGAPSLKSASSVRTAKVIAVAQSKLTFIKPAQTAIPRHPMPFAAKNMFYDERWIEKQERGFTWWINYVLTPDDFKVNTEVTKVSAVSLAMGNDNTFSIPKAPTKEEMSFSTYTARRKLNRLRRSACQLFTSEAMVKAIQRLELEVEARRLLVRKDRHLWKDIGERRKVLDWLLSYNPLWLRIGLETIFGELLSLESNNDALGLAMFILQRLLWNPDIAAEFRHPKVPHLYKDGHEEALSRFTLKKLLLLVCFLDKAKESRLIEHDPCLFCVDAEFKTSKDLLLAFSRDFLSGEGILPRHLGYLGLPVSHVQKPLDEFNFAVKNLAVDLKCGIRLVRVMELLIQDWSLSTKLRLPAISRLQKVHNTDIALQILKSKDIDLKDEQGSIIESRDIVDGHREKTLSLLWKIIFAFHVEVILDEDQLRDEIGFLKRTLRTKRRLDSLRSDRGLQPSPVKSRAPYEHSSTKITLLMDWTRAVCDFYNLKVENFTVTFSDGRVLCYLIHRYHPGLVPEEAISHSTTQTVECSQRGRLELDCSASDSDSDLSTSLHGPDSPSVEFKELLENERNNFKLVNTAVSFLGGVPAMINPADMSNTIPNEKVVMSYLTFLCARLLDLRNETRAARVIQGAWRKYRLKKDLQLYMFCKIVNIKFLLTHDHVAKRRAEMQDRAAIIIQSVWRGHVARNRLRKKKEAQIRALQYEAATVIQAQWRMCSTMRAYQRLRYYTIIVQAQWRMRSVAAAYGRIYWAATVLQKHWRALVLARRGQERYLSLRTAVMTLQRGYRRWKAKKTERENHAAKVIQGVFRKWHQERMTKRSAAAVRIQSWYRMHRCLNQYRQIKRSTILIQAQYRGHAQRCHFKMLKLQDHSAVIIQSAFRGHTIRKQVARMRSAAVIIQRWFRASVKRDMERLEFVRIRCAAVTIQAAYRGKVAREFVKKQQKAATVIQAVYRRYTVQSRYLVMRKAAAIIQQKYRAAVLAHKTLKDFQALRNAAIIIQANWRGRAVRKMIENRHKCATLIQAYYRRHKAQAEYRSKKVATVVLQRHYRAYVAGREMREGFLCLKAACVTLQAQFRGMRARAEIKKKHQAATVIQSTVRMFLSRKRYVLIQSASIIIQSRFRALLLGRTQQNEYRELKQATRKIQAVYRGFRVREDLKKRNNAARAIQAHFRMYRMRMAYLATKCAAIIIQEHYRAKILKDQQLQRYKKIKAAAVVIQKAYRGHMARRNVTEMHRAAVIIQRKFFTIRERNKFLAIKTAAVVCQQRYRAVTLARIDRLDYLSKRRAAICLQAAYRGYKVRKQVRIQHMAAVTIQSHFRRYQQRKFYKRLCWAASVVKARYRANKEMRSEMNNLSAKKKAAVVLQAAYRGMKCRQVIKQRHQAACVIQRAYKAHGEHRDYLNLRSSVVTIQQRYRATVAAKKRKQKYQNMRRAAIILQASYRGWQVRKEVVRWHHAATVIQSEFRKHREEVKFQAMRLSVIIIQRYYRAWALQKQDRENFLKVKHSAIVLQAAFRGQCVRNTITKMHKAATVIQTNFKRHKQQSTFRRQCWAACVLQQRFRAQRRRDLELKHYQMCRKAAIKLQAAYRGWQVKKEVARWHQAATVIQSEFRKHKEEVKFRAMRLSAIIIQRYYRAWALQRRDRKNFLKVRHSAIVLQATFRGQLVRNNISKMHKAATVIQTNFKRHKQQSTFRRQRWAARVLQQRFRAHRQRELEVKHYQMCRKAAIVLQAACRGMKMRRNIKQSHSAASVIQRAFRAHCERRHYLTLKSSILTIQRRYRATVAAKEQKQKYQKLCRAAAILQAVYRSWRIRKEVARWHQAATVIQSEFRKHKEEVKFQAMRLSAIIIQRHYRSSIIQRKERENFLKVRQSVIVLQAAFRGQRVRNTVTRMHQAATVIQANFRKHKQQSSFKRQRWAACVLQQRLRAQRQRDLDLKHYQEVRKVVIHLQAAFRGLISRRMSQQRHQSATVIQRAFRAHYEHKQYLKLKSSVLNIQQKYRATVAAKAQRAEYLEKRNATIILQAAHRGWQARVRVARWHWAATIIQSEFRKHREVVKFQALQLSAIIIQRHYRSHVLRQYEQEMFLKKKQSTIILQAAFRGWCVRREIRRLNHSATVIQSCWIGMVQRRIFHRKKEAAVTLQRWFRAVQLGRVERNNYTRMRQAAVTLQTHCRAWSARRQVLEAAKAKHRLQFTSAVFHHLSAIKIQRALRAHWALESAKKQIHSVITIQRWVRARQQRRRYLEDRRKVVRAQRAIKSWLARRHKAASVIQLAVRKFLLLRRQKRVQQGIVKAQALWRGHRSRRLNDKPKIVKLRHRLHQISAAVREEDKLCNKTSSALDYLLRYKQFSYILEALKKLETATRLSPECCERLVESGATTVIFTLIRCCNRSVPCMDVITFSIQILLNLSKYHKTIEAVYSVESSVVTLLDLLQRYREKAGDKVAEKGGSIFTKACFLLALLLQDKQRAAEVTKLPKALDMIRSIYRLTARKHKMDAERTVTKQKMNASVNGSFFVLATPRKSRPAPKFAPDWVLRKDKLKDVVAPLRAIQMVAETLSVVL